MLSEGRRDRARSRLLTLTGGVILGRFNSAWETSPSSGTQAYVSGRPRRSATNISLDAGRPGTVARDWRMPWIGWGRYLCLGANPRHSSGTLVWP